MQTNDRPISELMKDVHTGKAQLPDFQRGWVWDDNRIRALIASITSNFPIGAAMFLEYGNENIRFKYRVIEGAPAKNAIPSELILDGQQRLTSMYSSLYSEKAVDTVTDKGQKIKRYYYIDIDILVYILIFSVCSSCFKHNYVVSLSPNQRIPTKEILCFLICYLVLS